MQENKDDNHNFISLIAPSTPTKYSSESIISKAKKYIGLDRSFTRTSSNSVDTLDTDAGDSTSMINKLTSKISNTIEVEKNYTLFFIILALGIFFIFCSLFFLPFVLISPSKFVSFFSIGSLITISSFIFIYGTSAYLGMLFGKDRRWISVVYVGSVVLGIYYAFLGGGYFISLLCACTQLVTLIVFTLSFIPGGESGISFVIGFLRMPFDNLIMKVKGTSYLPS